MKKRQDDLRLTIVGIFRADLEGILRPLLNVVGLELGRVKVKSLAEGVDGASKLGPSCLIIGLYLQLQSVYILTSLSLTWNS